MAEIKDRVVFDAKVSDRKVLLIPVNTLKSTPYNPPSRTKSGKALDRMVDSIKKYGQIYPLLVTTDRDVVDGNRRLAAMRISNIEFAECIVTDLPKDEIFGCVNTVVVPMGGKGWLSAARGGGINSLPAKERGIYEELHSLVGNYGIDKLVSQNIGLNILPFCKVVCAQGITKRVEEVVMITAEKKLTNKLNAIIRADMSREEKCDAINHILDSGS